MHATSIGGRGIRIVGIDDPAPVSHVNVYSSMYYRAGDAEPVFVGRDRYLVFSGNSPAAQALAGEVTRLLLKLQEACDKAVAQGAAEEGPSRAPDRNVAELLTYNGEPEKWGKWADIVTPHRPALGAALRAQSTPTAPFKPVTLTRGDWERVVDLTQAAAMQEAARNVPRSRRPGLLARLWDGFLS